MITEDYVSFETAKLLKEKGFDEPCYDFYDSDGIQHHCGTREPVVSDGTVSIAAPSLALTMKWLREVHCTSIDIVSWWDGDKEEYYYTYLVTQPGRTLFEGKREFHKHSQACDEAIRYCIENRI